MEQIPLDHASGEDIREGVRLLREGRATAANEVFERGLKRNPTDGVLHFLNGLAYHARAESGNKTDLELAETGYQLALKFDPDNIWAAYLLGHIAYRAQRYVDAENYFAYGMLYQPNNPELLKGLLVSAYAARDLGMAAWAAKQLEPLAAEDPIIRRNATLAYAASGHFDDAQASLAAFASSAERNTALQPRYAALQRRVGEWQDYFERNNLPQFAFSDAKPFEDRRRARENQAPAPSAVPRAPVTQSPVDQRQAPPGALPPVQNRGVAAAQPAAQPEKGPRMALVDVAIIRTEENRSSRQGVNLLSGLQATLGGTLYNFNYVSGSNTGNGVNTLTHTINPVFTLAGLTYNLNIFNDGVERAEVLARPSLLAIENKTSEFFSGGVWHVQLVSNLSYGTIEQVPIGINLKVTPQFLDEDLLLVDVNAERSFLEERSAEVAFTAFAETTKTSVSATAKLRFGETLILSGLSENESNRQRDGVPVLEKLPVVQYLFSQRSEESLKRSVLILLTPRKAHFMDGPGSTDAARALPPPPQGERFRNEFQKRQGIRPNLDAIFAGLEYSDYYRQFRSGDMQMARWEEHDGLDRVIRDFFQMLYF
ncbi:MAG: hypothetical protein ACK4FJ_11880 [Ferrovibrio sp.]|uniref:hypothetical protein n=1 Tax=Ferrovibrio sp. TaxID=1917215 RepID=UPI003918E254